MPKITALQPCEGLEEPCKHIDMLSILNLSIDLLGLKILSGITSVSGTRALCGDEACQDFKVTLLTEATHTHTRTVFNYSI